MRRFLVCKPYDGVGVGVAVGVGVGVGVAIGVGVAVGVGVTVGLGVGLGLMVGLVVGLGLGLGDGFINLQAFFAALNITSAALFADLYFSFADFSVALRFALSLSVR